MKKIWITYTSVLHNGSKARFAVECENEEQAREVGYHLNSRPNVKNIRMNKSGRNLPCKSAVFFYNEYIAEISFCRRKSITNFKTSEL